MVATMTGKEIINHTGLLIFFLYYLFKKFSCNQKKKNEERDKFSFEPFYKFMKSVKTILLFIKSSF